MKMRLFRSLTSVVQDKKQIAQLEAEVVRLSGQMQQVWTIQTLMADRLDAVQSLHQPHSAIEDLYGSRKGRCRGCDRMWPCATAEAACPPQTA